LKKILIIILCLYSQTALASGLFTHPYKGYFTFQFPYQDPWYWIEGNSPPDKWEHYMGNYAGAILLKKRIGTTKTILLLGAIDLLKEWGDGYREGFSVRDMSMNALGILSGLLNQKLLCDYNIKQQKITLTYYFQPKKS
jgi:hypothetical protein